MKFLRRIWYRHSKLGRKRKNKRKWKKPTGRDNKMREKRRGYPVVVSIGYKKIKLERKKIILVNNIKDLENLKPQKNEVVVLGNMGKKKKIEIAKKAKEMKIQFQNLNIDKFLKSSLKNAKEVEKKNESK